MAANSQAVEVEEHNATEAAKPKKRSTKSSIEIIRKIVFYSVRAEEAGGEISDNLFDYASSFDVVNGLDRESGDWYHWIIPEKVRLMCWVDHVDRHGANIRLGRTNLDDIPPKERNGVLKAIQLLTDEGIADITHAVFFPDGTVGCEFSQRGPKVKDFTTYLRSRSPDVPVPMFSPLLQKSAMDRLRNSKDIYKFQYKIDTRAFDEEQVKVAKTGFGAILRQLRKTNTAYLDITVGVSRGSKPLNKSATIKLAEQVSKMLDDHPELSGNARLYAECILEDANERVDINLLLDRFVFGIGILKGKYGAHSVNSESAFKEIRRCYEENKSAIRIALPVSLT